MMRRSFEMLLAAGSGAALVVAPPQVYAGEALTALLQGQRVSAAVLTPTVLSSLDRARLDGVDTLITGGEACLAGVGGRLGAGSADVQRLRPHRDHRLGHLCAAVGGAAGEHRRSDSGGVRAGARCAAEPGADRGGGRVVSGRAGAGARLCGSGGVDRGTVRGQPLWGR